MQWLEKNIHKLLCVVLCNWAALEMRKTKENNELQSSIHFQGIWVLDKNYTVLKYTEELPYHSLI